MSLGRLSFVAVGVWTLAAAVCDQAVAVVLLHDQFQTDGILKDQVPSPGPGAAWNPGSATGVNAVSITSGEALLIQTDAGTNGEDIASSIGDRAADATTFARFDVRLPSVGNETLATDLDVSDEGVFFVTLRGTSASTSQRARFGILNPTGAGDFRFAINADNANLALGGIWETDLDFDTTYRAVISYNAATGQSKLWLDPTSEVSANVSHTGGTGTVINRIILRQNDDYAGKQFIDNVVIASSFSEALNPPALGVPGDYNGDTLVDAADYTVWRDSLGQSGPDLPADGVADMEINELDYEFWKMKFGGGSGGGARSAALPEPSAAWLAVVALVGLSITVRRATR